MNHEEALLEMSRRQAAALDEIATQLRKIVDALGRAERRELEDRREGVE